MHRFTNFIAGEDAAPIGGGYIDVAEPATGRVYAQAPDSTGEDIQRAVEAARRAFPEWSALPAAERGRLLERLAGVIESRLDLFARAEATDAGKAIRQTRTLDIPRAAANFRYFAHAVQHAPGEMHEFAAAAPPGHAPGVARALNYTLRRPRGVAGLISPWNLPLYLLTWKIAPAIATGNTCVCKPSEVTPATAHLLGAAVREAGIPAGVVNLVHGRGAEAGAALVKHPDVPTISFTGSTTVGRWIAREAGERLKRTSLELGGKNAMIVCAGADVPAAADLALRAGFTNQGQVCLCTSRLLVHRSIARVFVDELVRRVERVTIGDPLDEGTTFGPLVSREHFAKVDSYVRLARDLGAKVHTGGGAVPKSALPGGAAAGFYFAPTVLSGLDPASRVEQEEIFGPVVHLTPFDDDDEAAALANATPYGLCAVVCSRDLNQAHQLAERVDAGIVWINTWLLRDLRTPFGGVKQSGVGREGGLEAIRFFTEPKNVCLKM